MAAEPVAGSQRQLQIDARPGLDVSQGLSSYLLAMEDLSLAVGQLSKIFKHAEGWRRHLHFGFCKADADPLRQALGKDFLLNKAYERDLDNG